MSAQGNIALVEAATQRITSQGPRAVLDHYDEYFTDDFRWAPITAHTVEGGEYRGREGFVRYVEDLETTFSDLTIEVSSIRAVGEDTVVVELQMRAKGTGSGVPLDLDLYWVFRFEGPKVASGRTFVAKEDAIAAAESGAHA